MTSQLKLVQLGVWGAEAAAAAGGDLASNIVLSAANSSTATAVGTGTAVTSSAPLAGGTLVYNITADLALFSTVGTTFNTAQLTNQGSAYIVVFNNGASTLLVFPPQGGSINGQALNMAFGVGTIKSTTFLTTDGVTWVAQHAG